MLNTDRAFIYNPTLILAKLTYNQTLGNLKPEEFDYT